VKSYVDDDGGPGVFAVEEAQIPQSLFVRVGPVYDDDNIPRREPGVWIEYMPEYNNSTYMGPLLLSPQTWHELVSAVNSRLSRRSGWRRFARRFRIW
jgi:hypothetical protein